MIGPSANIPEEFNGMRTMGEKAEDRRANIRLHRVLVVEIDWDGEYLPTVAVDISVTGFQVASPVAPEVGSVVKVRIYLRNGPSLQAKSSVSVCIVSASSSPR